MIWVKDILDPSEASLKNYSWFLMISAEIIYGMVNDKLHEKLASYKEASVFQHCLGMGKMPYQSLTAK